MSIGSLIPCVWRLRHRRAGGLAALAALAPLARKTQVSRQTLHEALSPKGNPRLRTFQNVLGSLGLRLSVKPMRARTAAKRC